MALAIDIRTPTDPEEPVGASARDLTPAEVVAALDKYIVGQDAAKRAVAVALRNRVRRRRVDPALQADITPKNILMIGPTGVGKTEIARRLAQLAGAPFVKVDATKFTEIGYVGRDVDSMVRDLMENALELVRRECEAECEAQAAEAVENRLLDLLHPYPPRPPRYVLKGIPEPVPDEESLFGEAEVPSGDSTEQLYPGHARAREQLRAELGAGLLEDRLVEITVEEIDSATMPFVAGDMELNLSLKEMLSQVLPRKRRRRKLTVAEARARLLPEELGRAIDADRVTQRARERTEELGIIFLDELDKVAMPGGESGGPAVSREGVQRDLLPLIEGSVVRTKYGPIRTDHILFIAAGAFHLAKPSDLIPELQGRFPIRVELEPLTADDFIRILTEPRTALTRQYAALLAVDGIELSFTEDGIAAIARLAAQVNEASQDIGARRLHTLLERVLEAIAFEADGTGTRTVVVDQGYVEAHVGEVARDEDLSRYIL